MKQKFTFSICTFVVSSDGFWKQKKMPFCDKIQQTIQIIIKKPNYLNGSHKDFCLAFFSYT